MKRSLRSRIARRLRGLPRNLWEAQQSLAVLGALRELGWQRSLRDGPIDSTGAPIPWITYPALDVLTQLVRPQWKVFEYGAGHSTEWFARRVEKVVSVESDSAWIERLSPRLPTNAVVMGPFTGEEYHGAIRRAGVESFDCIMVDGQDRARCIEEALGFLSPGGVLVLDNSDRPSETTVVHFLAEQGFMRVDFTGFSAQAGHLSCTSLFFLDGAMLRGAEPREHLGF